MNGTTLAMYFLTVVQQIGLTLSVGSSTFALIFYVESLLDGVIDTSERRFMHTVYFVLRLGMGILVATNLIFLAIVLSGGDTSILKHPAFWFQWTLLLVIIVSAILMHFHKMPMWLGPGLSGGSWFMFLIVYTLGSLQLSFLTWSIAYLILIVCMTLLLWLMKVMYIDKKQQQSTS